MPEISVIVPVYKVEATLNRCVDSVLSQTFCDFEVILVDDGSPDRCGAICDRYASEDQRVSVIHKENGGLSDARNAGLKAARGSYVMFLDSDDYLTPDCLEKLLTNKCDMMIGSLKIMDYFGSFFDQKKREDQVILSDSFGKEMPSLLREERINYIHAKLFRMSIITENRLEFEDDMLTSAEDTVFIFTFLAYCGSIFICGDAVHYYTFNHRGLARKFYLDRYLRSKRLNAFLIDRCQQLGLDSDEMKTVLIDRRVSAAASTANAICRQKDLTRKEKIGLLQDIYSDEELKLLAKSASVAEKSNIDALMRYGCDGYLWFFKQKQRKDNMKKLKKSTFDYGREFFKRIRIRPGLSQEK